MIMAVLVLAWIAPGFAQTAPVKTVMLASPAFTATASGCRTFDAGGVDYRVLGRMKRVLFLTVPFSG